MTTGSSDSTSSENRPPGITINRTFDAPARLVYEAWTDPVQFAVWFGGEQATIPIETVTMDLRVGGKWTATMTFGAELRQIDWHGEYLELSPWDKLVLTLSDHPGPEREIVTVRLTEIDGKTDMLFTQHGNQMTAEQYEGARAGWLAFFDTMDSLFPTG